MPPSTPRGQSSADLFGEETLRGERQACKMRWIVQGLIALTLLVLIALGRYPEATWRGLGLVALGALSNLWLQRHLRRKGTSPWLGYFFASLDLLFLTSYTYLTSIYVSPLAVVTYNTLPVYCLILVFVSLRQDRRLLIYCSILSLVLVEGLYWLRYPDLDQAVLRQLVSADPLGIALKGLYLLGFGLFLMLIPQTLTRLLGRQAALFEERRLREENYRATLEQQVAERTQELNQTNQELQTALDEVKALSGLLPICTNCKKIRDDQGYWQGVEDYIRTHSQADFTHGICPDCLAALYPQVYKRLQNRAKAGQVPAAPTPTSPRTKEDSP
jgi:hypothetical protein